MHGILGPLQSRVHLPDHPPLGLEAVTQEFLSQARASAVARFEGAVLSAHRASGAHACHTEQRAARTGSLGTTGSIVIHASQPLMAAWSAAAAGTPREKAAHVSAQLQLVLQDLADHDAQDCLALTDTQCDVYDLDVVQLVAESLERTTFPSLGRPASVHWEGTLVQSLRPAMLVLVISIGL
jgi:hypothetical protein